jgi:hypothetical protein
MHLKKAANIGRYLARIGVDDGRWVKKDQLPTNGWFSSQNGPIWQVPGPNYLFIGKGGRKHVL